MSKQKKQLVGEWMPEFEEGIKNMPEDSRIFVEKSLEIVNYIHQVMEAKEMRQKDLAAKMGKTEAELSKILSGMHNLTLRSISKLEAALGESIISIPKNRVQKKDTPTLLSIKPKDAHLHKSSSL